MITSKTAQADAQNERGGEEASLYVVVLVGNGKEQQTIGGTECEGSDERCVGLAGLLDRLACVLIVGGDEEVAQGMWWESARKIWYNFMR